MKRTTTEKKYLKLKQAVHQMDIKGLLDFKDEIDNVKPKDILLELASDLSSINEMSYYGIAILIRY